MCTAVPMVGSDHIRSVRLQARRYIVINWGSGSALARPCGPRRLTQNLLFKIKHQDRKMYKMEGAGFTMILELSKSCVMPDYSKLWWSLKYGMCEKQTGPRFTGTVADGSRLETYGKIQD